MNPVLGAARHFTRTVYAPREAADSPAPPLPPQRVRHRFTGRAINLEPVLGEGLDQVINGGPALGEQMHGEYVAQFDTSQVVHRRTVACSYDINSNSLRGRHKATWVRRVTHVAGETSAAAPIRPASPPSAAGTTRSPRMNSKPA